MVIARGIGDTQGITAGLFSLALLPQTEVRPSRSATLTAAAEALREAIGWVLPPRLSQKIEPHTDALRAVLDEEAFAAAWAEGAAMDADAAVAYALEEVAPVAGEEAREQA